MPQANPAAAAPNVVFFIIASPIRPLERTS